MHIKVVTINTWKGEGDYYSRRQLLARRLQELDAQVIACQECFYSAEDKAGTASFLSEALQMNAAFLPCRPKKRLFRGSWVDSFSGLAVLSSLPLIDLPAFDLPDVPEDEGRKAQQVAIAILPGKKLLLTNIHLTHLPGATALRSAQLECVISRLSGHSAKDYDYRLICGDFNAGPNAPETTLLRQKARAADTYTLGKGKEPRRTLLHASGSGDSCVDHIFTLPLRDHYPACIDSSVVLDRPDEQSGLYASDHFGISTTLVVE